MAEMILCDHLEELWSQIDQQHLLYLISVESVGKLDQREKLESYIKEYLCLAPHSKKFTVPQTAQVLHRSASRKENFSGYKAAKSWKAIGRFADNLVLQPWRKEFKELKLYCGFYKHEVEENLSDAELMFEAMGYCRMGNSTMAIADILDPDRITNVSKDSILAYVECQIMEEIWEHLMPYYNFSWLEILEFRENHTGTPDQAIRALRYKRHQRQYEEQMYLTGQYRQMDNHSRPDYGCAPDMGYFNHMHHPGHSYSYPVQARYSMPIPHLVSPGSVLHSPPLPATYIPQAIKPQDIYPPNGYHVHSHYSPQDVYPNYHSVQPHHSTVPTAQLIELDSTPSHNSDRSHRYQEDEIISKWQDMDKNVYSSGKVRDDGIGSWKNLDRIYRNLESQGYKKNYSRGEKGTGSECKLQGEVVEKMRKMNIARGETEEESRSKMVSRRDTATSTITTTTATAATTTDGSPERNVNRVNSPQTNSKKEEAESDRKRFSRVVPEEEDCEKWECISCTYLNPKDNQICDMCFRSKDRGDESRPQPSGGQVCSECTLVNEVGLTDCAACSNPLKDSPTYI